MKYLLDTNVFIEAKNRYYAFEIAEGFWEWLELLANEQSFLTVKEVREEIINSYHDDQLEAWLRTFPLKQFIDTDLEIQANQRQIANYIVKHEVFSPENKYTFLEKADPWLIATAMTRGFTIVTHEAKAGAGTKKVKIPNICEVFGVDYISLFDVMKVKKVKLRL
jgi:predicted nucleic acid-binding protein